MSTLMFFAIVALITLVGYAVFVREKMGIEEKVKNWCRQQGHTFLSFEIYARPHRAHRYGPYTPGSVGVTFKRGYDQVEEERVAEWNVGVFGSGLYFPMSMGNHQSSESLLQKEGFLEVPLSYEERIRMEVSQRLDAITAQQGWAQAHDLDGSGHVDSAEWEALRQKIEAEVRASFEESPEAAAPTPFEPNPQVVSQLAPPNLKATSQGGQDDDESIW